MRRIAAALLLAAWLAPALPIDLPPTRFDPPAGAALPLDVPLQDSAARELRLGDFFGRRPVVLVFGYHRCPQLCGLLMQGLLEAMQQAALGPDDVRIVAVSIDPEDTPASAAERERVDLAYARFLGFRREPDLHRLVGSATDTSRLALRAGFVFERRGAADDAQRFAHGTGVVVATPAGRIATALLGVRFDAAMLRRAVARASGEQTGEPATGFALLCAHLDAALGRHDGAVLAGVRALALLTAAGLAALCWRHRRRSAR